jgi:hypothetical protein
MGHYVRRMRREWDPEDLIACWTLLDSDWSLVANKTGATRLGFVVLLKFFEIEGRFPLYAAEVPEQAVVYPAGPGRVAAAVGHLHPWPRTGRVFVLWAAVGLGCALGRGPGG